MVTTAPGVVSRSPAVRSPVRRSTLAQQQGLSRWQLALRVGLTLGAIVFAYQYSLTTLIRGLSLDTPLAYLGLVPFIALALASARSLTPRYEHDINDRYVDYIIGLPLVAAALAIVVIMPVHASTFFWLWRLDLISLPLFVAGSLAIVFGVRALWRLKLAIAFLFLAWPLPYISLLNDWLQRFTELTVAALKAVLSLVPLASSVVGYDGATFSVGNGSQSFLVSVASACAGVNGLVGFILVGIAFAALVRGRTSKKVAWLIVGLAVVWTVNLVRILVIFLVGDLLGEAAAIDVLHPFIGLITFNVGVLAMILVLPLFGLRIGAGEKQTRGNPRTNLSLGKRAAGAPVARAGVALIVVLVAATTSGLANIQMEQFAILAQDLGAPRLAELAPQSIQLAGWTLTQTDSYPWVSRFFGDDASWTRYSYDYQGGLSNPSPFRANEPVVLDVISTSDLSTFSAYDLQACYRFHNYRVLDAREVGLAGGVTAHSVVYYNRADQSNWLAVYWEWPVSSSSGQRYERVVVNMIDPVGDSLGARALAVSIDKSARLAISDWFGAPQNQPLPSRLVVARDFLVGFSHEVVLAAASHSAGSPTAGTEGSLG